MFVGRLYLFSFYSAFFVSLFLTFAHAEEQVLKQAEKIQLSEPDDALALFESVQPSFDSLDKDIQARWLMVATASSAGKLLTVDMADYAWRTYQGYWSSLNAKNQNRLLTFLADAAALTNQYEASLNVLQCAKQFVNSPAEESRWLINMAVTHQTFDKWQAAIDANSQALALAKEHKVVKYYTSIYNNLGNLMLQKKRYSEATNFYRDAYVLQKRLGNETYQMIMLFNTMITYVYQQDWQSWKRYQRLFLNLKDKVGIEQINVIYDWMFASYKQHYENNRPNEQELAVLMASIEKIQQPELFESIEIIASGMGIEIEPRKKNKPAGVEIDADFNEFVCKSSEGSLT